MAKKKKEELTLEEKLEQAVLKDDEIPYDVPSNWVWTTLGNTFSWGSGGTPSRKNKSYYNGEILWIKTGELNNSYIYDTEEKITGEGLKNSSAKIFQINTIVIAMYGATIGKVAIMGKEASTNQACACASPSKHINYLLLFYYLVSQKNNFINKGKGGAQPNISQDVIKKHYFPLPPVQEQTRIVNTIESLFEKLDKAKELIELSLESFENRKAAILHKAFTGELTKKWREENGVNFDNWEEKKLKENLQPMTTKKPDVNSNYFFYIDIESIDNKKQVIKCSKKISTIDAPSRASKELRINDILFSLVRPYLKNIAIVTTEYSECIASTGFYICRCKSNLNYKFLYYFLNQIQTINYYTKLMKGDNSPSIRKEEFENIILSLPSINEQQKIVKILDTLLPKEDEAKELINQIEKIELMKKSILARAFRGELNTNNPNDEPGIELLKKILEDNEK